MSDKPPPGLLLNVYIFMVACFVFCFSASMAVYILLPETVAITIFVTVGLISIAFGLWQVRKLRKIASNHVRSKPPPYI